jgi:hypothetical protein
MKSTKVLVLLTIGIILAVMGYAVVVSRAWDVWE